MTLLQIIFLLISVSLALAVIIEVVSSRTCSHKGYSFEANHCEILDENILAHGSNDTFSYLIFVDPDIDNLYLYTGGEPTIRNGKKYLCVYYTTSLERKISELNTLTSDEIYNAGYNVFMNAAR